MYLVRLKRRSRRDSHEPVDLDLTGDEFVPLALAAFDGLVNDLGLLLSASADYETRAFVEWQAMCGRLRVTDDRRASLVEVFVVRRATDADQRNAGGLIHNGEAWLPLWAIVRASGGDLGPVLSGRRRLQYLSAAAAALNEYGAPFMMFERVPLADVAAVIEQNRQPA